MIPAVRITHNMPFAWRSWMEPVRDGGGEGVDLWGEFSAAQANLNAAHLDWLANGAGVSMAALERARMCGAGTVLPSDPSADKAFCINPAPAAGTYLPGSIGSDRERGCLILGVWSRLYDERLERWALSEFGSAELRDLVAVDVRDPSKWWMRRGGGFNPPTWLGQGFGPAAGDDGGVVDLHATPLDWLRAGCTGQVLLDAAGCEFYDLFRDVKYIRVGDARLADRLYKKLRAGDRRFYPELRVLDDLKKGQAA